MSDDPTGAVVCFIAGMLLFGILGLAVGGILWASGQPWHHLLTCAVVGVWFGVAVTALGLALGGERGGTHTR
jgi:Flp pilus assembly protein protease CpaA